VKKEQELILDIMKKGFTIPARVAASALPSPRYSSYLVSKTLPPTLGVAPYSVLSLRRPPSSKSLKSSRNTPQRHEQRTESRRTLGRTREVPMFFGLVIDP
jgi:hypothetical protein